MEIFRYTFAGTAFVLLLILETVFPLFSGWKNRFRHIVRNIGIVIVDNLIFFILLSFVTGYILRMIEQNQIGLFN